MNNLSEVEKLKITNTNHMLGKGLQMPFAASNSGSRKLMFGTQLEHRLPLVNPDVPYIQTGYEMQFGLNSSSYVQTPESYTVIAKIPKFSWCPNHHYFMIVLNEETKTLNVYERKEYKHITEKYGYLFNNDKLDSLNIGDSVPEGTTIQKSTSFDEFDNRMDGKNLLTMYNACEETIEDAILISESASKKLASPLISKFYTDINDNNIPLNIYGDNANYKIFPDIGEEVVNNQICSTRVEKKDDMLYSQSSQHLKESKLSDSPYVINGRVVDINIYCNAPQNLEDYAYNSQIKRYYEENKRMCGDIINALQPYIEDDYNMTYDLQKLYSNCVGVLTGKQYYSERVFSNIKIEFTVVDIIPVKTGDKLSNRYGGKGITAKIIPDNLMPRTYDNDEQIDVILNMCGVYGRENAGQLFEITVSYVSMKIIQYINMNVLYIGECVDMYLRFLKIVAPSMVEYEEAVLYSMTDDECIRYISSIYDDGGGAMYLAIEPMTENMTIDKVKQLYDEFPWAKPGTIRMPIRNSVGQVRYAESRRPIVYGYQYIYRLKQYAEEKFSVTSLSATNVRNENCKSKNSNNYKALYSRTPIRFGDMETGNLIHLGAELVVQMLMLYSTSPHARRLASEMLTGDPFSIDINLDMKSKNRNVEILNVYLKTIGLKLIFKRIPKKKQIAFTTMPIQFFKSVKSEELERQPIRFYNKGEKVDNEKEVKRLLDKTTKPIEFFPIIFDD